MSYLRREVSGCKDGDSEGSGGAVSDRDESILEIIDLFFPLIHSYQ